MSHRPSPRRPAALAVALACAAVAAAAGSAPVAAGAATPARAAAAPGLQDPQGLRAAVVARLTGARDAREAAPPARSVIVKYRSSASSAAVARTRRASGIATGQRLALLGAEVVPVGAGRSASALAQQLRRDPAVEYAVPDVRVRASAFTADTYAGSLWGLDNTGQALGEHPGVAGVDVDAPAAWARTRGDGAVVAVIDTGVDTGHPDLRGRMWTNAAEAGGARGVDDDRNGCVDDVHGCDFYHRLEGRLPDGGVFDRADGEVHGTHVAGTIAATAGNQAGATAGNQAGVAGVAPGARIMSLKVLDADGYGEWSDIVLALDYARSMGATVINMSLGASVADDPYAADPALADAIARTRLAVVVSAGNEAVSNDHLGFASYPASFDLPNIVSVAAVDHRGRLAPYSNWGPRSVDLGAPGTSVLSTVPRQPQVVAATSTAVGTKRGRIMTWGFGLEDVTLESRRAHLLGRSLAALGASTSSPILLVQDDEHDLAPLTGGLYFRDAGSLYRSALAAVGYRNVTVVRVPAGRPGPTAAQMAGRFVVWQTGQGFGAARDALTSTLQPRDVEALAANAAAGGRVLLAGAEALYEHPDLATAPTVARFVRDVLRVAVAVDGVLQVHAGGGPGNFALSPGAHPYRDGLRPLTTAASPWLTYPATDYAYLSGTSMAAPHVSGIAALAAARAPGLRGTALAQHVARSSRLHWPLTGRTVSSGLASAEIATR